MCFLGQIVGALPAARPTISAWPISQPNSLKAALSLKATGLVSSESAFCGRALYGTGRSLVAAYARLMLDVDIQWHAPLPEGPKILAANHPTTTDPLYLLTLISEPVSVLLTTASFDVPAVRGSGGETVEAMVRQIKEGRSVAVFPEGALSPLSGGFHRPHSGVARVALRTGAPVIPVGTGLQRHRIHVTEAEVKGDKAIGHLYARGPYAMTVGRPLNFEGDVHDRERVHAAACHIMNHVRDLARESEGRIRQAQATEAATLHAPAWLAAVR
jgi:1-acyl-sn-glycerol-3-phosphate acyltransferase